jgi:osmotically inducible protein OsmC
MLTRKADATWQGKLKTGRGHVKLASGALEKDFSFNARFGHDSGTNPEELVAAAHASCFSMALAQHLSDAGYDVDRVQTRAEVELEKMAAGFAISHIQLISEAAVPNIDDQDFRRIAEDAKIACPVSKALAGTMIDLTATLKQ